MKKTELLVLPQTKAALVVNEANRLHKYAQSQAEMAACAGRNAVMAGLKIGKMLTGLKILTPHGGWGELFSKDENKPNVAHELHLNFNRQTANRYMRCYQKAKLSLDNKERVLLDTGLDGEPVDALPELVDKATNGAETPRQMMINCGIVVDKRRSTRLLASTSTIADNRGVGKPQPVLSPDEAMAIRQQAAHDEFARIIIDLRAMLDTGRLPLVDLPALLEGKDVLNLSLKIINALTNA